jgi:copper transport protein
MSIASTVAPRPWRAPLARRAVAVGALVVLALVALAGTASAHAQLEGSDPPAGGVVATAPTCVTLVFGEPVDLAAGSVQVFDDHLVRVDVNDLAAVDTEGNRIRVGLRQGLPPGTYTVSWRVSSTDTHPVSGTFTFSVGAASAVTGVLPGTGGGGPAEALLSVTRGLSYAGLALGPGALLVLLVLWPAGLADRRARRVVTAGVVVLLGSTLGGMLLQGVWASGLPLSALWSSPDALDTHSRRFDVLFALRSYLVVGFGAVLAGAVLASAAQAVPRRRSRRATADAAVSTVRRRRELIGAVAAISLVLLGTWSLAGHPAAGALTLLAVAADLLHLAAMAVWLGGLVLLATTFTRSDRAAELAAVVPRFSRLALACVTVLVVTGSYQSLRDVGSLDALTGTEFGRLLLLKLAGVVVLVALGNVARRWVLRHTAPARRLLAPRVLAHASGPDMQVPDTRPALPPPDQTAVRSLRRGVVAELVVAAAVLGLTAVLVATVPARQAWTPSVTRSVTVGAVVVVDLTVDAPRVGDTVLHLDVHRVDGTPVPVQELTGTISLPAAGLGPLPVRVLPPGPDAHLPSAGLTFPAPGDWTLRLTVETSPLEAASVTVTVPVT